MGNVCACNRQQDSDYSDKSTSLKAKRHNDTEITANPLKTKLISAVKDENKDSVKSLLEELLNTSDIFAKSWNSDSYVLPKKQERTFEIWRDVMYTAMEKDTKHSEEIMKLLLDSNRISSLEIKMDDLLLHRLIRLQNKVSDKKLRLIEMLLKSGKINVNARDENGRTALHCAKEEKLISLLIRYGADVNKKDNEGKTPLMPTFMLDKKVSVLQTILKEARTLVDLDAIDFDGRTALMTATIDNKPDAVQLLLNAGASVNFSDYLGLTALHHALFTRFDHYDHFPRDSEELKKRKDIFTILLDAKVEVRHKLSDWYREIKKRKEQRMKIVEMLLRRPDIDVNALSFEEFSPLDMAEGWIPEIPSSIKRVLREKGATLNVFRQTETQSSNCFHLDVRCKFTLQRLLLNLWGYSESDEMLTLGSFEKRLLSLIEAFQDQILSGKDKQGRTALHLVAISFSFILSGYNWEFRRDEEMKDFLRNLANTIVNKFITIGCNVKETDIYGRTPLHYANCLLKESLISHGADASIKDKDGNRAIDEMPQESSTKSSDIVEAVIDRNDKKYFLRLMNNKQMEIEVKFRAYDDRELRLKDIPSLLWEKDASSADNDDGYDDINDIREFWRLEVDLKTAPKLLWENGEHAFHHPSVEKITKEVTDLMSAIAKEIERLDSRIEIKSEFVGRSNERARLGEPDEFDFNFVLTKISELCEVSLSPELPTGFVRLKRKPAKVDETSDLDSFFREDGILNTEKLNWQFKTLLHNAMVNIANQQSLDWNLEMPIGEFSHANEKTLSIKMTKPLNSSSVDYISIDVVPCIHVDGWWPDEAISNVSDEIKSLGCNFVFDVPQDLYPWVPYSEPCARISFAKAESEMFNQNCANAREAYMIGQAMTDKQLWNSKYTLTNSLLYCIEALTPTSEKASQLGLSLEELESKFHQMDRYLWLKCLMKCHLEFVSQEFCPCYFLPNFSSPIGKYHLKNYSPDWLTDSDFYFPYLCKKAYALHHCTLSDTSELCCQLPAPDPLWERFDPEQLIAMLLKIAYK